MTCHERDRLILAFALALNDQNEAWTRFENARNEADRDSAQESIIAAKGTCHELQAQLFGHCRQHGC